MKAILSPAAESDLEAIGDYIAMDNPRRAVSFIREMRARFEGIAAAPRSAPLRENIGPGIRVAPHGSYLIFYRIADDGIRIERVLHGARDLRRLFA